MVVNRGTGAIISGLQEEEHNTMCMAIQGEKHRQKETRATYLMGNDHGNTQYFAFNTSQEGREEKRREDRKAINHIRRKKNMDWANNVC